MGKIIENELEEFWTEFFKNLEHSDHQISNMVGQGPQNYKKIELGKL